MNFNLISMRPSYIAFSFELRITRKISLSQRLLIVPLQKWRTTTRGDGAGREWRQEWQMYNNVLRARERDSQNELVL